MTNHYHILIETPEANLVKGMRHLNGVYIWTQLQGQIYLGSESFMHKMQALIEQKPTLNEIPRAQRRAITQPLAGFEKNFERNEGMARAYLSGQHSMVAIAKYFGLHYSTVSRAVRNHEGKANE